MLTADDKKEIRKIVREEVSDEVVKKIAPLRESVITIEQTYKVVLDVHQMLMEHSEKLTDHEDRISVLESA